jgi:chromosome segregation ATPase
VAAVVALALGGVFQLFGWPYVGKMVGLASSEKPKVDVETQLGAAKRENTKLKAEVGQFKGIGSPAEVKKLQQGIAQARDSQGPVEGLESKFNEAKERETAYDELVKRVSELQAEIGNTQGDINTVKSQIEDAKRRVLVLRKQTELEYARFQNEAARAEISRRVLIELEKEDNRRFQEELRNLQERLSEMTVEQAQAVPTEGPAATDSTAAGI